MSNDIVGHKTKRDPVTGELYHEPIRQDEAATILAACDAEDKRMAELMPTEQSAIEAMFSAWARLKQLGWREACYCPKDRSTFLAIEPGSTGIFNCIYEGEWPNGTYWILDAGDMWPATPVLFKRIETP